MQLRTEVGLEQTCFSRIIKTFIFLEMAHWSPWFEGPMRHGVGPMNH